MEPILGVAMVALWYTRLHFLSAIKEKPIAGACQFIYNELFTMHSKDGSIEGFSLKINVPNDQIYLI